MILLNRTPMAHSTWKRTTWLPPTHCLRTRTRLSLPRAIHRPLLQIYKTISHRLPDGRRLILRTTFRRARFQCQDGWACRIRRI